MDLYGASLSQIHRLLSTSVSPQRKRCLFPGDSPLDFDHRQSAPVEADNESKFHEINFFLMVS